ncbi:MAG: hypothetical protein H0W06_11175 [Chloroflexia bacterium]|nr:hypothetical protein [Chloroflexia bacterium]
MTATATTQPEADADRRFATSRNRPTVRVPTARRDPAARVNDIAALNRAIRRAAGKDDLDYEGYREVQES